jgi:hypothetical protein
MKRPLLSGETVKLLAVALVLVALGGCARGCTSRWPPIHLNPNMDHQPKVLPQSASDFFADGASMRPPVEGTVARGELFLDTALYEGKTETGEPVAEIPIPVTDEVLERGAERYGIYCGPCHGGRGDGKGMLNQRAGVAVANLLDERIRNLPAGQIFDVVTNGLGLMSGYRYPIPAHDRWAIITHVRVLQGQAPPGAGAEPRAAGEAAGASQTETGQAGTGQAGTGQQGGAR